MTDDGKPLDLGALLSEMRVKRWARTLLPPPPFILASKAAFDWLKSELPQATSPEGLHGLLFRTAGDVTVYLDPVVVPEGWLFFYDEDGKVHPFHVPPRSRGPGSYGHDPAPPSRG